MMWLGVWVCLFGISRRLISRKWTVTYQCQHFTVDRRISECDHKCETRNAEPDIGTDGSNQTRRNPRVNGYGSRFGLPRVSGSGFWMGLEPNRPVLAVQTRTAGRLPRPVANTRLCWCSCLGGGSDIVAGLRAHIGGQYCDYGLTLLHSQVIIQDPKPEVGDAPLTLISRMGQQACRLPFTSNVGQ